jgi:HPt (histidine-containing phosphotransfer) domain-containing protein
MNNEVNSPKSDIIDYAVIDELSLLSDDNKFIKTLIYSFISDTKSLLISMEKALSENNVESYLEFAHALKGSAGSIGALQIHNLCRSVLESKTRESNYLEVLQKTHQAFRKTEKLLLEYIPVEVAENKYKTSNNLPQSV